MKSRPLLKILLFAFAGIVLGTLLGWLGRCAGGT